MMDCWQFNYTIKQLQDSFSDKNGLSNILYEAEVIAEVRDILNVVHVHSSGVVSRGPGKFEHLKLGQKPLLSDQTTITTIIATTTITSK